MTPRLLVAMWTLGGCLALGYAGYSAPPPNNGWGMAIAAVGMWLMFCAFIGTLVSHCE